MEFALSLFFVFGKEKEDERGTPIQQRTGGRVWFCSYGVLFKIFPIYATYSASLSRGKILLQINVEIIEEEEKECRPINCWTLPALPGFKVASFGELLRIHPRDARLICSTHPGAIDFQHRNFVQHGAVTTLPGAMPGGFAGVFWQLLSSA